MFRRQSGLYSDQRHCYIKKVWIIYVFLYQLLQNSNLCGNCCWHSLVFLFGRKIKVFQNVLIWTYGTMGHCTSIPPPPRYWLHGFFSYHLLWNFHSFFCIFNHLLWKFHTSVWPTLAENPLYCFITDHPQRIFTAVFSGSFMEFHILFYVPPQWKFHISVWPTLVENSLYCFILWL